MFGMAGIGIAAAVGFVFALGSLGSTLPQDPTSGLGPEIFMRQNDTLPTPFVLASTQELKKFSSAAELKTFLLGLEQLRGADGTFFGSSLVRSEQTFEFFLTNGDDFAAAPSPQSNQGAAVDKAGVDFDRTTYSTTNVQVQGVDEPDFLKNDGKYVYILSGDRLTIVDAYPPESAEIAVKIALDIQQGQYLQNMFLSNNTLVIFYQEYGEDFVIQEYDFAPQPIYSPKTHALIMDVSDREKPEIVKDFEISGNYNNARMIGDFVYFITASDLYDYRHPVLPKVMESSRLIVAPEVYYFDNPELYYSFNTVTSIDLANVDDDDALESKSFMMNPGATLYVSENNIYIAYQKNLPYPYYYETNTRDRFFEVIVPELPQSVRQEIEEIEDDSSLSPSEKWDKVSELLQDTYNRMSEGEKNALFSRIQESLEEYDARIQKETQKTVIHKIEISDGSINYESRGEVPGRLLNQFSMDEDGNRFRVATTSEYWSPSGGSVLHNNVYVLDADLEIVGELEEIAKGESIYSARFMGDRLYLVTFERIDPFFVIDLSDDDPKVLGELKLPGYSNYLHPYDDDHVIGIGKETKENQFGGVDILGVKLALFDVSDVRDPELVDDFEIGGSGTDSEVLYDHKALLFDRSKDVLSIPVSIFPDYAEPRYTDDGRYIQPKVWRGFYVFGVDPDSGFDLKGQVEHFNDVSDFYYGYGVQGSRSFYIEDVLYTVTLNNLIKMNDLSDLDEIGQLKIGTTGEIIPYPTPLLEGDATQSSPPSQR